MNRLRIFLGRELMSSGSSSSNSISSTGAAIVVLDDDDDVQVCSPRSFAQAARKNRDDDNEELLQLRLGLSGTKPSRKPRTQTQQSKSRRHQQQQQQSQPPPQQRHRSKRVHPTTIDLTTTDDCEVVSERPLKKKSASTAAATAAAAAAADAAKPVPVPVPAAVKELSLTCGICFDTMKEETSTVCGHLFCGSCIQSAITAQKRCPTCRRKLSSSMVHRIYISGNATG